MTEAEVTEVVRLLDQLDEQLTATGNVMAAGAAHIGRQAVRKLWTELHPPDPPKPFEVPFEDAKDPAPP